MFDFLKNFFDENSKRIKSYQKIINQINGLELEISKLNDEELSQKTDFFKKQLKKGKSLDELLPQAFAVVREAVKRTIGERAYDVQLMSAITLHQGAISEQRTGEGKTHSVIFPAYLNALTGKGVHIVTPNDYLTRVGTGWYPKALHLLGISTSCIIHEQSFILDPDYTDETEKIDDRLAHLRPISRREAYLADVTYGTNNEFGFDYLRDHMAPHQDQVVQRPHHFAIVDEVDFVLIDESRTPLIISSPNNQPTDKYYKFSQIAADLQPTDYVIDEKSRSATLSEYGIRKVERILGVNNLYEESFETIHYIENAIKARALFHKDKDYVVKDGEVVIVDEFTGRLMSGRRWSDGLHQAVEAKEGVTVQRESQTWATITFQNYFRLYEKLAGMTGTAATEAEEFKKIYNLDVVSIPTNKPLQRLDQHDLIFKSQRSKYAAIVNAVEEKHRLGQPVLIGTTSIAKNEIISSLLRKKGLPHQVLNAKNHRSEAEIIAKAGKKGSITVATNMAGRGVDIILGGPKDGVDKDKWQKEHDEVIALGGLSVIGTERHESRRIDNQLRGRAGRQGDPGYSQFYIALDDDIMRIFGGEKISSLMSRFNMPEDTPLTHPLVSRVIEQIQVKVEGFHFDARKSLVEYDDVINKQRQIIYHLRDEILSNQVKSPDKNHQLISKYLANQINSIVNLNTDYDTNRLDLEKTSLEFNEILPLNSAGRSQLKKDLAKSDTPAEFLTSLLEDQWQSRVKMFGQEIADSILAFSLISTLDPLWVEHLTALDDLRDGVRLRGYAQKDPLVEYRKEGYEMFQRLLGQFEYNLARKIFRLEPVAPQTTTPQNVTEGRGDALTDNPPSSSPDQASSEDIVLPPLPQPIKKSQTVGRNDPCPCGSGKKYKKCCYPKFG
ncbi:MAG TPA: preprotein translocase subunit SecA [Candidatus Woesebacteria bacterium]|jgi:preprotein translocase subunit SecA|nr:preprotein translocase subunit SecA [Candidatus Shapirobacteria bacterium]HOR02074.1 preprotein translocase subunit SecA [Candidatus Woesebacteria bacterium]